ncbi:hypothetical protein, partial [Serratia nevei]
SAILWKPPAHSPEENMVRQKCSGIRRSYLGMKGKEILPGWKVNWSEEISNEFAGTSISVVILTAEREV